jgi:hypothetical protein
MWFGVDIERTRMKAHWLGWDFFFLEAGDFGAQCQVLRQFQCE